MQRTSINVTTGEASVISMDADDASALSSSTTQGRMVPQSVTRFQAMAALSQAGRLAEVVEYMDQPGASQLAKLAWSEVLTFDRSSLLIMNVAIVIGLSQGDIDDLFLAASGIEI